MTRTNKIVESGQVEITVDGVVHTGSYFVESFGREKTKYVTVDYGSARTQGRILGTVEDTAKMWLHELVYQAKSSSS